MDWFLYDRDLRYERMKKYAPISLINMLNFYFIHQLTHQLNVSILFMQWYAFNLILINLSCRRRCQVAWQTVRAFLNKEIAKM